MISGAAGLELASSWVAIDSPAVGMNQRVVESANQSQIAFVGFATVAHGLEVVDVAPVPRTVTVLELAMVVAYLNGPPEGNRYEPGRGADVEDL